MSDKRRDRFFIQAETFSTTGAVRRMGVNRYYQGEETPTLGEFVRFLESKHVDLDKVEMPVGGHFLEK